MGNATFYMKDLDLWRRAKAKAASQGISFSSYLESLIRKDLENTRPIPERD